MSGHSRWSQIKYKKGVADSRKGQAYTKLANLIALAAKSGADPATNFKLRLAVQKAKEAGMPNTNIERSIARGSGAAGGAAIEAVTYEGYGPGGAAILVQAATDNRNRTAAEVRSAFTKHGGRLGEAGSVAYQFETKGVINLETTAVEAAQLAAIEAGATDVEDLTVYTAPADLEPVKAKLAAAGYAVESAEVEQVPKQTMTVTDTKTAASLMKTMEALEELDDVTETFSNFDILS